jgi:hypothetical protein
VVIFGDDIGQSNISAYTFGLMGYRTPVENDPGCVKTQCRCYDLP